MVIELETYKNVYIILCRYMGVFMYAWDPEKSKRNKLKHGFSFEEILDVFNDPYLLERVDWEHSNQQETRFQCLGDMGAL